MHKNPTSFLAITTALAVAGALTIGCGDTNETSATGGSGGTTNTGGSTTTSSGGTGGTGGENTGGTSTGGTSTGGTSTGGTGGSGGATEWAAPACASVSGTGAVTFTLDEGSTLAPTQGSLSGVAYTYGLAALDIPNTLLAEHEGDLLRSEDAGCTWSKIGTLSGGLFRITPARGGIAYAWVENGAGFYRIENGTPTLLSTPAQNIVGLGTDPIDGKHLRVGDASGAVHDSADGGMTWTKHGTVPAQGIFLGYRFAFDPADLDHALFGQSTGGAWYTTDGTTWKQSSGLVTNGGTGANTFSIVVSPVDGNLVWAESLEVGPDTRHIYRSTDGGASFDVVVTESAEVTLINGSLLSPHAENPDVLYFVFGTSFQNYGTDLYRYDHTTNAVTKTHNGYDEISAMVPSPADPSILYLALTSEDGI